MSATAPVIEVRNMNKMTWLSAPTAIAVRVRRDLADGLDRDSDAGRRACAPRATASASSNEMPVAASATRAAGTSAACSAIAASTAGSHGAGELLGWADVLEIARAAATERRVVARRMTIPSSTNPRSTASLQRRRAVEAAGSSSLRLVVIEIAQIRSPAGRRPDRRRPTRAMLMPAVGHPEHDDQDHRQDDDEEQAHPVADGPDHVDPGDLERLHARHQRATGPSETDRAGDDAHRHQDDDRWRGCRRAPTSGPDSVSIARRNQAWGVMRAIRPRISGAWLSGMKTPPMAARQMATIALRPLACSIVFVSVETKVEMPVAAKTAATTRMATSAGGPQLAWTSNVVATTIIDIATRPRTIPASDAAEDDGRGRDRRRDQPAERPVASLAEQRERRRTGSRRRRT